MVPLLWIALAAFFGCAVLVHLRGRVRLPALRQLVDHSTWLAPYNVCMYAFSRVPNRPFLDLGEFPELQPLAKHWRTIRDEAQALAAGGRLRNPDSAEDVAFQAFFKRGWQRFYLKWYGDFLPSARSLCPATVALLESLPNVHAAMFARMAPASRLGKHRDPFAGSLRYHLSLVAPGTAECGIEVDGQPYFWRDGEAVLFDATFVHRAHNRTGESRTILFCDVERPLRGAVPTAINRFVIRRVVGITAARNDGVEPLGLANRVFPFVAPLHRASRRLKARAPRLYRGLKVGTILGVLALVVVLLV
jgi:beta-hydroxylase